MVFRPSIAYDSNMLVDGKMRRIIGDLLAAAALLGALAAVHTGLDIVYQPNCPACQQESNPGCQASALTLGVIALQPQTLHFLPYYVVSIERKIYLIREFPPRSPPVAPHFHDCV